MDNKSIFIKEAFNVAQNTECLRRQVGAVLVKNGKMVLKTCNNIPKEIEGCSKVGCIRNIENYILHIHHVLHVLKC